MDWFLGEGRPAIGLWRSNRESDRRRLEVRPRFARQPQGSRYIRPAKFCELQRNEGSHTAAAWQRLNDTPALACFELCCARFLRETNRSRFATRTEVRGFASPSTHTPKGRAGEHKDKNGRNDCHTTHGVRQFDTPAQERLAQSAIISASQPRLISPHCFRIARHPAGVGHRSRRAQFVMAEESVLSLCITDD